MDAKPIILLASRSKEALADLLAKLSSDTRYELRSRHIVNGHADPLYGLSFVPDVVVMSLNERGHDDLAELTKQPPAHRPPMIVLAEHGDAQTMRIAMQAGARDFLPGVLNAAELIASIERAAAQTVKAAGAPASNLIAVVNAKGGSGATFVASNLAYTLNTVSKHSTALMSLDLQFESLMQHFDLRLKHDLMEVLENADSLDAVALGAYMTQHASGLRLLAARPANTFDGSQDRSAALATLLDKLGEHYEQIVVDMPRRVDPYVATVLRRADRVVLVVQQTVGHLRDAVRMLQILAHHGLKDEQILVVVNRYEKDSLIGIEDVQRSMRDIEVINIPGDFKTVAESINLGVPIYEHARGSVVTKSLTALSTKLGGRAVAAGGSRLGKAFSSLLRI